MHKPLTIIAGLALALSLVGSADAKQCRDPHGKFMKCPPAAHHCRDAHGKFAKCGTPGVH